MSVEFSEIEFEFIDDFFETIIKRGSQINNHEILEFVIKPKLKKFEQINIEGILQYFYRTGFIDKHDSVPLWTLTERGKKFHHLNHHYFLKGVNQNLESKNYSELEELNLEIQKQLDSFNKFDRFANIILGIGLILFIIFVLIYLMVQY